MENLEMEQVNLLQHEPATGRGMNKRRWNSEEELVLVDILLVLAGTKWKVDTGYKNGFYTHVEKLMEEKLPGCGIKGKPHIESKIKILKKQLGYILEIQKNGSGFGWDDDKKMVIRDKSIFTGWAKSRDGATTLYIKSFVHFDKLCEIYAKDRAIGDRARGLGEEEITKNNQTNNNKDDGDVNEMHSNSLEAASRSQNVTNSSEARKSKYKRKFGVIDSLQTEFMELSKSIKSLVEAEKKSASEMSEKRSKVFETLANLERLSSAELVKAASIIGQDDKKVEVFFSILDDYKVMFTRIEIGSTN